MNNKKTGLLISFIGMIISLGIGFGFILTLVGMCMMSGVNEAFKKSRNNLIGSLVTSIAGFFVIVAVSGAVALIFSGMGGAAIGGLVTFIIASIVMFVLLYIFNRNAYINMMEGCAQIGGEENECRETARKYSSALLAYTIVGIITAIFIWVPILNILLILASVGIGIWYFVMQIFLIMRVWQTYQAN